MHYVEAPRKVDAMQWTAEIATASSRMDDPRFPQAEKNKFTELDKFTENAGKEDGTWLSIVDPHEDVAYGRWGVYCARESVWKALHVGSWVLRYESDGTFDVLTDDEFAAKYVSATAGNTAAKKNGETK